MEGNAEVSRLKSEAKDMKWWLGREGMMVFRKLVIPPLAKSPTSQ
jgi:hypothetical protein